MSAEENPEKVQEEIHYQSISDFLEGFPPNQLVHISNLSERKYVQNVGHSDVMRTPEIQLHCPVIRAMEFGSFAAFQG